MPGIEIPDERVSLGPSPLTDMTIAVSFQRLATRPVAPRPARSSPRSRGLVECVRTPPGAPLSRVGPSQPEGVGASVAHRCDGLGRDYIERPPARRSRMRPVVN